MPGKTAATSSKLELRGAPLGQQRRELGTAAGPRTGASPEPGRTPALERGSGGCSRVPPRLLTPLPPAAPPVPRPLAEAAGAVHSS